MSRGLDTWREALGRRCHAYRSRCHDHADITRHRGRSEAGARSGKSRPDHRGQHDGHRGDPRLGTHAVTASKAHLCQFRCRLQASRPGPSRRAAAGRRLCDAASIVWHLQAGIGIDHRTLRRSVRSFDGIGASVVGLRHHGPRDGEPKLPPCAEPPCTHGARRRAARAREYARCGRRLHPCGGRGLRHRFAAARTAVCATAPTTSPPERPQRSAIWSAG